MNNVVKHADAGHVAVVLHSRTNDISLIVEDDGDGFDAELTREPGVSHGYGLTGMRERTELLGGTFDIESNDSGTSILVRVPVSGSGRTPQP